MKVSLERSQIINLQLRITDRLHRKAYLLFGKEQGIFHGLQTILTKKNHLL